VWSGWGGWGVGWWGRGGVGWWCRVRWFARVRMVVGRVTVCTLCLVLFFASSKPLARPARMRDVSVFRLLAPGPRSRPCSSTAHARPARRAAHRRRGGCHRAATRPARSALAVRLVRQPWRAAAGAAAPPRRASGSGWGSHWRRSTRTGPRPASGGAAGAARPPWCGRGGTISTLPRRQGQPPPKKILTQRQGHVRIADAQRTT